MTVLTTSFDFMTTSANEVDGDWSNIGNILNTAGSTSVFCAANGTQYKLELTGPKAALQLPGGFPLINSVNILGINTELRARFSSSSMSKNVEVIIAGATSNLTPYILVSGSTFETYTDNRTLDGWGLTQQEAEDFLDGTSKAQIWIPNQAGTSSGTFYVESLKFQVSYEYQGSLIPPLRPF